MDNDTTTIVPTQVEAAKCPHCEEIIDEPGDAVYGCSRCGGTQIGERRCNDCNIFMAKSADLSCPVCEEPLDEEPVPDVYWRASDGTLHDSAEDAADWDAHADDRAAAAAEARARFAAEMDTYRAEHDEWMDRLRGKLAVLAQSGTPAIVEAFTRSIGYESTTVHLDTEAVVDALVPDAPPQPDIVIGDGQSWDRRTAWIQYVEEAAAARYPQWGALMAEHRGRSGWADSSGFSVDIEAALDAFISIGGDRTLKG